MALERVNGQNRRDDKMYEDRRVCGEESRDWRTRGKKIRIVDPTLGKQIRARIGCRKEGRGVWRKHALIDK